ncbi:MULTISPECIES: MBL fold metallo-hydrolase [unclassified Amycolatopsis]|uniref:MBL fold metallo-hydrolase n=1 Tax=unclassified Amycolatopsis TaxID=2618356 RepID=UPI001C6A258B|nr:MBL fold metallo-hydrolase [Amycolatopsis sp. DSM 110486]QYN20273.1 MBL fold metallo-hydrolase [Amycolatopsis sp. DSM 110486]
MVPTGCRFLVDSPGGGILVGCGAFDDTAALSRRNWSPAPRELHEAGTIVLPDASPEDCGFLPALVAEGWRGEVFATPETAELVPIALADTARLQAEEAVHANATGWSGHHPAVAPFGESDVERAVELLRPAEIGTSLDLGLGSTLELGAAGRRLGAAWVRVSSDAWSVVFSGVLGGARHPLLTPPQPRPECATLVLDAPQSGGDRGYDESRFAAAVHRAIHRGGSVLVPVSAVGLTEVVLTTLADLMDAGDIPRLKVVLDSPVGLDAVEVHRRARAARRPDVRLDATAEVRLPEGLVEVRSAEGFEPVPGPAVVLAGTASASCGRVRGHLSRMLPDSHNAVVLVGLAPSGTPAHCLAAGDRQVKIRGRYVPTRAEITQLGAFGTRADESSLLAWAAGAGTAPETVYVVQDEADRTRRLAKALHAEYGWCAVVPAEGERVLL